MCTAVKWTGSLAVGTGDVSKENQATKQGNNNTSSMFSEPRKPAVMHGMSARVCQTVAIPLTDGRDTRLLSCDARMRRSPRVLAQHHHCCLSTAMLRSGVTACERRACGEGRGRHKNASPVTFTEARCTNAFSFDVYRVAQIRSRDLQAACLATRW